MDHLLKLTPTTNDIRAPRTGGDCPGRLDGSKPSTERIYKKGLPELSNSGEAGTKNGEKAVSGHLTSAKIRRVFGPAKLISNF